MKNEKGFGALEILLVLIVMCVLSGLTYYFINHSSKVLITNDDTTFSFNSGTSGKKVTVSDSSGQREYYENTIPDTDIQLVATAYIPKASSNKDMSCGQHASFQVNIVGASHVVCNQKDILYVANFNTGGAWYQATIFSKDMKSTIDQETVENLLSSIEVK
jgi:hypothetical protein